MGPLGRAAGLAVPCKLASSEALWTAESADCHYMPSPRGALENLKLVPLEKSLPGPGEVKV